jgi:hypothetical protein
MHNTRVTPLEKLVDAAFACVIGVALAYAIVYGNAISRIGGAL